MKKLELVKNGKAIASMPITGIEDNIDALDILGGLAYDIHDKKNPLLHSDGFIAAVVSNDKGLFSSFTCRLDRYGILGALRAGNAVSLINADYTFSEYSLQYKGV